MLLYDVRLVSALGLGTLALLLAAAVWHDVRDYRIPNALVAAGMVLALLMHALLPAGGGFAAATPGGLGALKALQGMGLGLAALLPFYLLGAAGAGDAKLMAMVGAFLGPLDALAVVLCTFIAGAAMAVVWLMSGTAPAPVATQRGAERANSGAARRWRAKLPYSMAIAMGTLAWLALREFAPS